MRAATDDEAERAKRQKADTLERVGIKAQALGWVVVAAAVIYYTDFFHVLLDDPRVYRGHLRLAVLCFGINLCVGFYLTVWLPRVQGLGDNVDWSVFSPRLVPAATAAGLLGAFSLFYALWPVWAFLAPLLCLVVLMGGLFALHFVPWPF